MFCKFCGAQMADDAKFCPKCGKESGLQPAQSNSTATHPQPQSGLNMKILIPLVAIIAVLLVVIGVKVISNNKSPGNHSAKADAKSSSNGNPTNETDFSYDAIVEQCGDCNDAIAAYFNLMDSANEFGYDKDELNYLTDQYTNAMHHSCHADVIHVEGVPFVYRTCLGTYTGDWKGAGPFGEGEFIGTARFKDDIISYDGQWAYGLPEGEGYLYIQNFADSSWDLNYMGNMRAGMRDGTGHIYEYNKGGYDGPMYRIYDEVSFENDIMTSIVDVATYRADTKELLYYDRLTGDATGWVTMLDSWGANELNPEQQQMLEYAECALVIGVAAAMVHSAYKGVQAGQQDAERYRQQGKAETEKYLEQKEQQDLDELNAQKEQQAQAALQQQQQEYAAKAQWNRDKYYEAIDSYDPNGKRWDTQTYEYNMNYFNQLGGN